MAFLKQSLTGQPSPWKSLGNLAGTLLAMWSGVAVLATQDAMQSAENVLVTRSMAVSESRKGAPSLREPLFGPRGLEEQLASSV